MRKLVILLAATTLMLTGQLSGRRAPSFSLPDSQFKQHDLLDYRGKWLLLDFMRTDCPHCQMLSKLLESKKSSFGSKAAVLSVVISPPDTQATVSKYIAEQKMTSPMVFDQGQCALSYFNATPARPAFDTPHLFAISPDGMIVRDWAQADVETKGFSAELDALIAGAKKISSCRHRSTSLKTRMRIEPAKHTPSSALNAPLDRVILSGWRKTQDRWLGS